MPVVARCWGGVGWLGGLELKMGGGIVGTRCPPLGRLVGALGTSRVHEVAMVVDSIGLSEAMERGWGYGVSREGTEGRLGDRGYPIVERERGTRPARPRSRSGSGPHPRLPVRA